MSVKLREAFREGGILIGTWLNAPSPSQTEIIGHAGFDFVILDSEHSSYGVDVCEDLVRAADAVDLACLIRVSEDALRFAGKALDFGAQGVVVPHVESEAEARKSVAAAHYAPLGIRGAAPTVRATRFGKVAWQEHLARARLETLVVTQIEGKRGIENLNDILSVQGVDVVFIGTFDLSESLGVSGQLDHPLLLDAIGDIVGIARRKDKTVGIWMPGAEHVGAWIERGVQMITVANNDMMFHDACCSMVEKVRARIPLR